ncbi:protein TusC [Thalassotalea insulae]|uniref:Protein TusC n=1 Tax=Thalassotalea insulae TaxID=2056778 RepID=A0ABQ6H0X9_9GAMM|nr:sulfurtransferase complex subunit TusC [Thalassotalea insulae]GLX80410.1 protein TusC [Thalassotalea insulae]
MITTKSIAILNTCAPFCAPDAKDALDIAMIMGSYEQETHLFFKGDGVWQLVAQQQPAQINVKDFLKTFAAFEFYDLEHLYVCEQSLIERGISANFHIDGVKVLAAEPFAEALKQHATILTF